MHVYDFSFNFSIYTFYDLYIYIFFCGNLVSFASHKFFLKQTYLKTSSINTNTHVYAYTHIYMIKYHF